MLLLRLLVVISVAVISDARAADCHHKDVLGTSRVLTVDAKTYPRIGLKSFPQTLPLADKEVVLTFDDGPFPPTTTKVLAALASECVQATFFLIGRSAEANPQIVKKIADAGHSIGHHTWSHRNLGRIDLTAAMNEIDRGIQADERALHDGNNTDPKAGSTTNFFRFPGFVSTPTLLDRLQSRGMTVFGADLWASDWNAMSPEQELRLLTSRLDSARRGIVLLHDTKLQTARMLPSFLQYLRKNGYKIVHVVPALADKSTSHEK